MTAVQPPLPIAVATAGQVSPVSVVDEVPADDNNCHLLAKLPLPAHRADCQRRPMLDAASRRRVAYAVKLTRNAYVQLCNHCFFMPSDIEAGVGRGWWGHVTPEVDPMGVLCASTTFVRWILTEELMRPNGIDMSIRTLLAVVLIITYKLRSEQTFEAGRNTSAYVLSQFLGRNDARINNLEQATNMVNDVERELVVQCAKIATLVDNSPYTAFEFAVYEWHTKGLLTEGEMKDALANAFFWYYAAASNAESDVLEKLGTMLTSEEIGRALACVAIAAVRAHACTMSTPPTGFSQREYYGAARLIQNARAVQNDASIRIGAYHESSGHALAGLVSKRSVNALYVVFRVDKLAE